MTQNTKKKLAPHIPLKFEDAISAALQTPPERKKNKAAKKKKKAR